VTRLLAREQLGDESFAEAQGEDAAGFSTRSRRLSGVARRACDFSTTTDHARDVTHRLATTPEQRATNRVCKNRGNPLP